MKILVFIKQVADTEARIIIGSDGRSLEIENKYAINIFDEIAVEEAIRIKESRADTEITVCTYAPQRAVEALRTAIAMGADKAFLIDSTNGEVDDPLVVARILAGFAKAESFDIILCGRQAIDDENANIGPMVAQFLDVPHVSLVMKFDIVNDSTVQVLSEVEGGKKVSEVTLPALFTTQKGLNEPRVPLITGVMKAMKAQINVIDPAAADATFGPIGHDASTVSVLSYESSPERPPVKIIDGASAEEKVKELIRSLKEDAKAL